jgi:acetyl esterase/lipase
VSSTESCLDYVSDRHWMAQMTQTPPYLLPFVLAVDPVVDDTIDWYLPPGDAPAPAVMFVHGGPLPPALRPKPRRWPVYQGYGALAVSRGLVGVTFDHRFSGYDALQDASSDIADVVARVRSHPRVDQDRLAIWAFSGGGVLLGRWMAARPDWLRCVAASYPTCRLQLPRDDAPPSMIDALDATGSLPILLTRCGLERAELANMVAEFVAAAARVGAHLDIVDVPSGHHAFDVLDDTDESRSALATAIDWVVAHVR